jgi:hypothetical protein
MLKKGSQMKSLHGPAAVKKESLFICHWETGKAIRMMILSQKTCLYCLETVKLYE